MLDQTMVALGGTLSGLVFFGGIGFLVWLDYRGKAKQRAIEHIERMKSLEVGLPLPDAEVANAEADRSRSRAAGTIGFAVPFVMSGAALAATLIMINYSYEPVIERLMLPLLCTIWGVCGLVSLVVPVVCASALFRRGSNYRPPIQQVLRSAPGYAQQSQSMT